MIARLRKAATLHLLLLIGFVASSTPGAGAQKMAFLSPSCNLQEMSLALAPCMAPCAGGGGSGGGGGGNISAACCSSLNTALQAGHRCVCSLLLASPVFASLVTNLLTLPLPGCFLFAPSLATCQAITIQPQTSAPPADTSAVATTVQPQTSAPPAATSAVVSAGVGAAPVADPPATPDATVTLLPPEKRSPAGPEKAAGNGTGEAAPRAGQNVSRSSACRRHPDHAGHGAAAYALTFLTAVAVSWINFA